MTAPGTPLPLKLGGAVVYVDDVAAALDFHERAFGLQRRFYDPSFGYGELETGSAPLAFATHALGEMLMPGACERHDGHSAVEIAFLAADAPAVQGGCAPVAAPKTMPWGATVAYVRSAEGTLVGLSTPMG